jgi:hypothetical protein
MADDLVTLADMAKINDMNARDAGASDIFNAAPLLAALMAIESTNGATHTYMKYSGAPVVGFRAPNAGREHDKSTDTLVTIALKILDASFHADKKVVDIDKRNGVAGYMAREAKRHLAQAFRKAEEQLINGIVGSGGVGASADGYAGLIDSYRYLNSPRVVNCGGGATNNRSSVWAIRTVPDESGVCVVLGDGEIRVEDFFIQFVEDGDGKKFPAYMQEIDGWVGLQIATANTVARLVNVGATGPLTDDKIADLLNEFEEEAPATHLVMNRHARKQLQQSRTATTTTGAPAPIPTEVFGVPIITTSSISNNETAVANAP